jgi:hypothetical protein
LHPAPPAGPRKSLKHSAGAAEPSDRYSVSTPRPSRPSGGIISAILSYRASILSHILNQSLLGHSLMTVVWKNDRAALLVKCSRRRLSR